MTLRSILFGTAAALAMVASPALADHHLHAGGTVAVSEIAGQQVLVGADTQMTLYTFDKDEQGVMSNCYDQCAVNWPPLLVPADTEVSDGFTLMDRTDTDLKIVAYDGWPLYYWVKDQAPGDTTGDMVGEVWHTAVYAGM